MSNQWTIIKSPPPSSRTNIFFNISSCTKLKQSERAVFVFDKNTSKKRIKSTLANHFSFQKLNPTCIDLNPFTTRPNLKKAKKRNMSKTGGNIEPVGGNNLIKSWVEIKLPP